MSSISKILGLFADFGEGSVTDISGLFTDLIGVFQGSVGTDAE